MKNKSILLTVVLVVILLSLDGETRGLNYQAAKEQALSLHKSLFPSASPGVQSRIMAASRAALSYLKTCSNGGDLHAFLNKDLSRRFSTSKTTELQLLETLVFAEMISGMPEQEQLDLKSKLQKQQKLFQAVSYTGRLSHDTAMAIIRKIG